MEKSSCDISCLCAHIIHLAKRDITNIKEGKTFKPAVACTMKIFYLVLFNVLFIDHVSN